MSVPIIPICPSGCEGVAIDVAFDSCAPVFRAGEIRRLYIAPANAECFNDIGDTGEWATRLAADIKELTVYGEMPEAEQSENKRSDNRYIVSQSTYQLNLEVDEVNDTNWNFHRQLACNLSFKVWWETAGGMLYGGNCGQLASVRSNSIIPKERTEFELIKLTVKWDSKFPPERTTSPLS